MSERTQRMLARIPSDKNPICIEKYRITVETSLENPSDPPVLKQAKILKNVTEKMPIFILEDELIVGSGASKPFGVEVSAGNGMWDQKEIDYLKEDGYPIDPKDEIELQELNKKFKPIGSSEGLNMAIQHTQRLENYVRSGVMLPAWKAPEPGVSSRWGGGRLQTGLGPEPGWGFFCLDYEMILSKGLEALIDECTQELAKLEFTESDSYSRALTLNAMRIGMQGIINYGKRYAKLAAEMAEKEQNPVRKAELLQIAEICRQVPAKPARTFREAMQMFWFVFMCAILPSMVTSLGRADQFLYPYYKADIEAGRITEEEVIELFECLRIKCMEQEGIPGKENRRRSAGKAKWYTMTIGGVKPDGTDACNELTMDIIEAIMRCHSTHHTVNLRVADSTPPAVIEKAVKALSMGLTMPSFIGDKSYIDYFVAAGATLEQARNYCICGCNDGVIPGISMRITVNMVVPSRMMQIWFNQGIDEKTGLKVCTPCGDLDRFKNFEEFYGAFCNVMHELERVSGERINIENMVLRAFFPCAVPACFMTDGIRQGKGLFEARYITRDITSFSCIGLVNTAEALYGIKKLVYDDKEYRLSELVAIMQANWEGHEDLRARCKAFPKYGNDIDEVDQMVARLYNDWGDGVECISCGNGDHMMPAAISVTAYEPGGAVTGATADGRRAGEILADACASPESGADTEGFLAVLKSAMKLPQGRFSSFLFNQKFSPSALKTESDRAKLAAAIKVYCAGGGKHIQFNVIDVATMRAAQEKPREYRDLMVRVAGYSAYFTNLDRAFQEQLINRTTQKEV